MDDILDLKAKLTVSVFMASTYPLIKHQLVPTLRKEMEVFNMSKIFLFLVNCILFFANIFAFFSVSLPQDSIHLIEFGISLFHSVESLNFRNFLISRNLDKTFYNTASID